MKPLTNDAVSNVSASCSSTESTEDTASAFVGGITFCLYMFLLFNYVSGFRLAGFSSMHVFDTTICTLIAMATSTLFFLISYHYSSIPLQKARVFLTVGGCFVIPSLCLNVLCELGFQFGLPVICASNVLLGVGFVCETLLQILLFSITKTHYAAHAITIGALVSTALFFIIGLQGVPIASSIEVLLLVVIGIFVLAQAVRHYMGKLDADDMMYTDTEKSIPIAALPNELFMVAQGVSFGLVIEILLNLPLMNCLAGLALGSVGTLVALIWALRGGKAEITQSVAQRIALPIMIMGIILLPNGSELWQTLCSAAVMASLSLSQMVFWILSVRDCREYQFHPFRRFSYRQIADWAGFLAGMAVCFITLWQVDYNLSSPVFNLLIDVVVVAIVGAFAMYGADDERAREYLSELTGGSRPLDAPTDVVHSERFKERCDLIAQRFGLTRREREVFELLSRGRNRKHIQGELFIGPATAKTHIYNIYKKLGVNSHQSLIDLFEEKQEL